MTPYKRFTCRFCDRELPTWLPAAQGIDSAMLLGHLGQRHPQEARTYLARMAAGADIAETAAEAFEVVED
jgi:hypothetical protein